MNTTQSWCFDIVVERREVPSYSIKRTCLRQAAYVKR
jgi:hypothetical protein